MWHLPPAPNFTVVYGRRLALPLASSAILSLSLFLLVELPPHKERKFGRSYMRRDVPNTNEGRIKCFFVCKVEKSDGMRQEGLRNRPQVGESSSDSYIHEFISVARHRR